MGKLDYDTQIQHFSHPHPLHLNSNHQNQPLQQPNATSTTSVNQTYNLVCSCCKYPAANSDEYIYSCNPCNFHLHLSCSKLPQLITHPSHPAHPMWLLPVSLYPRGLFNCDACNRTGDGFSFHCYLCDYDLHVVCASKPLSVVHTSHDHPLLLTFRNPYETKGFLCDICSKIGSKQWIYRCGVCEFDAHLHCATGVAPPPSAAPPQRQEPVTGGGVQLHQVHGPATVVVGRLNSGVAGRQQSFSAMAGRTNPGMSSGQQSFSAAGGWPTGGITSGIQTQQSFPGTAGQTGNYYGSRMQPQQSYPTTTAGGGLLGAAIQNLVGGAAQQVGQTLMQNLIGGGGGGGGGDNSDGSTSSIYVNVGPTFTGDEDSSDTQQY